MCEYLGESFSPSRDLCTYSDVHSGLARCCRQRLWRWAHRSTAQLWEVMRLLSNSLIADIFIAFIQSRQSACFSPGWRHSELLWGRKQRGSKNGQSGLFLDSIRSPWTSTTSSRRRVRMPPHVITLLLGDLPSCEIFWWSVPGHVKKGLRTPAVMVHHHVLHFPSLSSAKAGCGLWPFWLDCKHLHQHASQLSHC